MRPSSWGEEFPELGTAFRTPSESAGWSPARETRIGGESREREGRSRSARRSDAEYRRGQREWLAGVGLMRGVRSREAGGRGRRLGTAAGPVVEAACSPRLGDRGRGSDAASRAGSPRSRARQSEGRGSAVFHGVGRWEAAERFPRAGWAPRPSGSRRRSSAAGPWRVRRGPRADQSSFLSFMR